MSIDVPKTFTLIPSTPVIELGMKAAIVIGSVALLLSLATAIQIKPECLSRMSVIAGKGVAGSTEFDWTDMITSKFNTQSVPVLKRSCLAANGDLNSFRMIILGEDASKN